ncbi:hypothetical protein CALVIDRAFT_541150 [Calocera viscosa TUFC12733]|uniref:DH domain-containing protein n=1 Tax=Calocera viscosa (strain TUFC12733) TaxID=1330018 RepID=A0A167I5L6_CALVF|nr:hypothetical protein CALVIDRAFT_541150 [Calocera viscosa TUFC12733]
MPTATEAPPPINTKRSRRHGVINLPAPDVPPSPTLPPLPPRSPLRNRARSSTDSATIVASLPSADASPSPSTPPNTAPASALSVEIRPTLLDVGISSSPLSLSVSAFGPVSATGSTTSLSPSIAPSIGGSSGTTKRTHALRELLDTERAYASDLALVRDVYMRLARDPMDPFASAPLPTGPPTPKAKPLKNRGRASTGGRPKTSSGMPTTPPLSSPPPFTSRSTSSSTLSPASLLPSLKRKTSTPSLARHSTPPETPSPRHKQPMSDQDVAAIFSNIAKLATMSEELCRLLHVAIHGDPTQEGHVVGDIMLDYIPRMLPHYKVYIAKHDAAAQHLQTITPQITSYLSTARVIISPLTNAWDLPSLLIKPVQRVLKYPLLLSAIADATPGEMRGAIQLREAKRAAEKACNDINEAKRNWEQVGTVLRTARQRKLASGVSVGLSSELEEWDQRLETMEKAIRRLASYSREWIKSFRTAMERLVLWADANERIMRVGMSQGVSHDGRGRWCRSAVDEILTGIWKVTDNRVHAQLIPMLTRLLTMLSSPRLLLLALRSSLPESVAGPVDAQLQMDLPQLALLVSQAFSVCIGAFAKWQCEFWEGVRVCWGRALGEEDGEWLEDLEGRLQEDTVVLDPALQEQIQLATPMLVRNNHFELPPGAISSAAISPPAVPVTPPILAARPRSMDVSGLTAQLYGLHILQPDEQYLKPNGLPRSITFDDVAFSRASSQAASASSARHSGDTFYGQPSTQSSSSELLPPFANGDDMPSPLSRDRRRSLLSSLAASEGEDGTTDAYPGEPEALLGLPLDEALRSLGIQEIDLGDDAQAQWAGLYDERTTSLPPEDYHTPPETPEKTDSMSIAAKGLKRLKSTGSAKSLTRMFNRSRAVTPEGNQTPPLPTPTPPMTNVPLPWASSYSYNYQPPLAPSDQAELAHYNFYPMPQRGSDPQPQPMLAHQTSVKDKVLAHRQHTRQTSSGSTLTSNPGSSRRSSGGNAALPSGVNVAFVPPPQPRRVHFLASPITAFHLPTPRYSPGPYTFHGLPFLTLRVGDIITVTQECGRPTDYRDFPLWTDGQEDRLLVARAEDGHEGWLLASFVVPIAV